jgi:hypothetical protein
MFSNPGTFERPGHLVVELYQTFSKVAHPARNENHMRKLHLIEVLHLISDTFRYITARVPAGDGNFSLRHRVQTGLL